MWPLPPAAARAVILNGPATDKYVVRPVRLCTQGAGGVCLVQIISITGPLQLVINRAWL